MTTFNVTVTYPDAEAARVLAALKKHWTVNGVVPTNAQVQIRVGQIAAEGVRRIVKNVESQEAADAIAEINVT